jgi:hypothetical protein
MTDQPAAPKAKRARKAKATKTEPTDYVVLERLPANEGDNGVKHMNGDDVNADAVWIEVDRVTTHGNEKTIIEKWANEKGQGGTFKLVPARSWKGGVRIFEQTRMTSEPLS